MIHFKKKQETPNLFKSIDFEMELMLSNNNWVDRFKIPTSLVNACTLSMEHLCLCVGKHR